MICSRRLGFAFLAHLAVLGVACAPAPRKEPQAPPADTPADTPAAQPAYPQPGLKVAPPPMPGHAGGDGLAEFQTAEDAEKAVADAEAELTAVFDGDKVEALSGDRCLRSCKALGSMRRAVDRLCELTEGDERCDDARGRLERSRRRVSDAGCSCS